MSFTICLCVVTVKIKEECTSQIPVEFLLKSKPRVFVLVRSSYCPFWFCNQLAEKERAGCFTLNMFMLS